MQGSFQIRVREYEGKIDLCSQKVITVFVCFNELCNIFHIVWSMICHNFAANLGKYEKKTDKILTSHKKAESHSAKLSSNESNFIARDNVASPLGFQIRLTTVIIHSIPFHPIEAHSSFMLNDLHLSRMYNKYTEVCNRILDKGSDLLIFGFNTIGYLRIPNNK